MSARFVTLLCLLAGPAGTVAAASSDWQVPVRLTYGYSSDVEDSMQGTFETEPSIELAMSERSRVQLSGRVRLDAEDELEPGSPDLSTYSPGSRPALLGNAGTAELRDAYLEFDINNGLARIGKQQIVWGRLDGLKVLDVLNPQSFREFILDDFDRSRISLWSVYLDKSIGAWRTELAWIPDATGHEIPDAGAWFQLTASRFRYGSAASEPSPPVSTERDADGIADSALGMRISRSLGSVDVTAVAYSGLDFEPLGSLGVVDQEPRLNRYYERRTLWGLSAESAAGPFVFRAELARQPGRHFNTRDGQLFDVAALDQTTLGFGVDVSAPLDVFVNIQYLLDRISDAPDTLVRPPRDRIVTAFLRRSFAYETVGFELRWYHSLDDRDHLLSGSLSYDAGDNTTLSIGFERFSGIAEGLFGQFSGRDRLLLRLEHTF